MGVYIWSRLPSEYQEVEYIQSSGTQYINTDIKLNQSHIIELKLNINSNLNQWDKFYGGGDDGSMLFAQYEKSSGSAVQNRIKITNKSGDNMYSINPIAPGYDHTFIHSNTAFYIDGALQSSTTATTFTMNTGLNIFAMGNSQSTGREKSSYKLYYMNIFNSNNSLDYCFIPCYRKSDDEIGLYDIVNDVFYTNSGTGTFSKGSDVNTYRESSLKNAYIGEVYEYSYDFTKGSISDLTNQGWTGLSNCSINTTYGLTSSTSWDTPSLSQPKLTSVLSSAKKIKIAYTCYKGTTGNTTQRGFGFRNNGTGNVWIYGDGSAIQLRLGGTLYVNTTSSQSVGTYNFSLDIDLTTKKAVYSGITSGTYTITDSDIATIRTGDELRIAVSSNSYIKNVSILVE